MKKQDKTIIKSNLIATSLLLFTFMPKAYALSGTFVTESKTINVGDGATINISMANIDDVQAVSGIVAANDNSCIKINSVTSSFSNDNMFAHAAGDIILNGTIVAKVNITGLKDCSTYIDVLEPTITSSDTNIGDGKGDVSNGIIRVIDNTTSTSSKTTPSPSTVVTATNSNNVTSSNKKEEVKQTNNSNTLSAGNINGTNQNDSQLSVNNESIAVNDNNEKKKEYNTDNYLLNIVPSVGMLSPAFDMKKEKYIIYLPYEVEKITFETELSNKETSKVEIDGNAELSVGENKYVFKVTAESGDIREYVVTVKRFSNYELSSSNNNLKNITLRNNTLLNSLGQEIKFDKDTLVYYYRKGDDLSYSYVADDESAAVRTFENGDTINIIVEAANGDVKIYNLLPYEEKKEEENKQSSLKYVLLFILGIIIGYLTKLVLVLIKRCRKQKLKQRKENQI